MPLLMVANQRCFKGGFFQFFLLIMAAVVHKMIKRNDVISRQALLGSWIAVVV